MKSTCLLWFSGFFGTLVVGHGVRLIFQWQVVVNNHEIPMMVSVIALTVAAVLSVLFWKLSCKACQA